MLRRSIAAAVLTLALICLDRHVMPALAGESGEAPTARGDDADPLAASRQELAAAERAFALQPQDAALEAALATAHGKVGDALGELGREEQARNAHGAAYAIWQKLAARAPSNAGWQLGLAMTEERLGDDAYGKADYAGALARYEASLARMIPLRDSDPSSPALQRSAALTMKRIGKARDKLNDEAGALQIFGEAAIILARMSDADPANAELQRDRAVIHESRGGILKKQGKKDAARAAYRAALGTYDDMLSRRPDDHRARLLSVVPLAQLADLEPKLALKHLATALAILKEAKAAGRLDDNRETWIASLEAHLAELGGTAAGSAATSPAAGDKPASAGAAIGAGREEKPRTPASQDARGEKSARTERRPARAAATPIPDGNERPDRNERPNKSPFDMY